MTGPSIFLPEALEYGARPEPIDGLAIVTTPRDWMILAALAAACTVVACWGFFGSVERSLHTEGILARPGERQTITATASGRVREVLVAVGSRIDAGAPLARLALEELDLRLAGLHERSRLLEEAVARAPPALEIQLHKDLINVRAEAAALAGMIGRSEIVSSPVTGEVTALRLTPGSGVRAGQDVAEIRSGEPAAPMALAFVPAPAASQLRPGMSARLLCPRSGGVHEAEIIEVSAQPVAPPGWLTELGFAPPRGHRVWLRMPAPGGTEGDRCALRIVLDEVAPLRLLVASASPD